MVCIARRTIPKDQLTLALGGILTNLDVGDPEHGRRRAETTRRCGPCAQ